LFSKQSELACECLENKKSQGQRPWGFLCPCKAPPLGINAVNPFSGIKSLLAALKTKNHKGNALGDFDVLARLPH
jgi:hypothetical protein